MWMPAVIIGHHGDRDIANLRFASEFCLLQVGHTDHVGSPTAIHIRLGLGGKLRTLHADISSTKLCGNLGGLACAADNFHHLVADGFAKTYMRHHSIPEKRIDAVPRAVEELVGNDEIERLMLFLQRAYGRYRDNALYSQLFEAVNVRAEIQ